MKTNSKKGKSFPPSFQELTATDHGGVEIGKRGQKAFLNIGSRY
jgi:hypothetical protein